MDPAWSEQYQSWQRDALWVAEVWSRSGCAVSRSGLHLHRWQSADGHDEHHVAYWGGRGLDPSWTEWIHAWVGEACDSDSTAWNYQYPPLRNLMSNFFNAPGSPALSNLLFVTPSRTPTGEWKVRGRAPLIERVDSSFNALGCHEPREVFRLRDLTIDVRLSASDFAWSTAQTRSQRLIANTARRRIGTIHVNLNRLYWLNASDENHLEAFFSGSIPTVLNARRMIRGIWRTHAPMIHLMRIDAEQMLNYILVELDGTSGELADIRWSRQKVASFFLHDPYFGAALREALQQARKAQPK